MGFSLTGPLGKKQGGALDCVLVGNVSLTLSLYEQALDLWEMYLDIGKDTEPLHHRICLDVLGMDMTHSRTFLSSP